MPKPTFDNHPLIFPPDQAVSFDADAFDDLIRSQGVECVHYRSLGCPVGLTDPDDTMSRVHDDHEGCSNGFIYTKAGVVTISFLGNTKDSQFQDFGRIDGSNVTCSFPRFYDDQPDVRVDMCQFDRLYLTDESIKVVNWLKYAAHRSGVDRLQFPAVDVVDLIDSHGKRYKQGVDFAVLNGQIRWNDGMGPGVDPKTGRGTVCSIRFTYRPYWYVDRMLHEVRVAQLEDDFGNRTLSRMPMQAAIRREFHFQKEDKDPDSSNPSSPRQKPGPDDGGFTSR